LNWIIISVSCWTYVLYDVSRQPEMFTAELIYLSQFNLGLWLLLWSWKSAVQISKLWSDAERSDSSRWSTKILILFGLNKNFHSSWRNILSYVHIWKRTVKLASTRNYEGTRLCGIWGSHSGGIWRRVVRWTSAGV
jgi:hypothetical protein